MEADLRLFLGVLLWLKEAKHQDEQRHAYIQDNCHFSDHGFLMR